MVQLKFVDVIGFRTEDPKYPTANLLRGQRWLNEKNWGSSVNDVTLRLEKVDVISAIDVGNFGTAFISIEVSRVGLDRYQILLPSTPLMTAEDCKTKENWTCVKMFMEDDFIPQVCEQKWDLVRIVCMQPFIRNVQFGLSFLKLFSSLKNVVEQVDLNERFTPRSSFLVRRPDNFPVAVGKPMSRSEKLVEEVIKNSLSPVHRKTSGQNDCSTFSSSRVETKEDRERENVLSLSSEVKSPKQICSFSKGSSNKPSQKETPLSPTYRKKVDQNECSTSSFGTKSKATVLLPNDKSLKSKKMFRVKAVLPCVSSATNGFLKEKSSRKGNGKKVANQKETKEVISITSDSDSDACVVFTEETTPKRKKQSLHPENCSPAILKKKKKKKERRREKKSRDVDDPDAIVPIRSPNRSPRSISSDVTDILVNDCDESENGRKSTVCPICSEEFLVAEIEDHAAGCFVIEEPDVLTCPICNRHFPPDVLQQHADVCAERYTIR